MATLMVGKWVGLTKFLLGKQAARLMEARPHRRHPPRKWTALFAERRSMDARTTGPRRGRMFGLAAMVALLAMLLPAAAGVVLGHQITTVQGTVDCSGNYSITAYGDVYGGV